MKATAEVVEIPTAVLDSVDTLDELGDWLMANNPRVMDELRQARRDDAHQRIPDPRHPRQPPHRDRDEPLVSRLARRVDDPIDPAGRRLDPRRDEKAIRRLVGLVRLAYRHLIGDWGQVETLTDRVAFSALLH